uniref:SET domain-containing protein n=1 Tax=Angiostrongylus cantonensis TaxID=6313 RepID=A0A0K0DCN9_ANGCA
MMNYGEDFVEEVFCFALAPNYVRLCKVVCVNSFSLTNQYSVSIGISLCIRLSAIDHSCRPNVRYAYRMTTAVMIPTLCSRAPISLNDARHSYINELLPKSLRQEILKRDYNFDCECEGCLDDERNDRMEAWYCINCKVGWLAPREDAKCTRYSEQIVLHLQLVPIFKGTLHEFNVLRIPSLRILYEKAIAEKRTVDMLTFGSDLLRVQSQFQDENDLAICHLKYGLAQAYKSVGSDDDCRKMLAGVPEAVYFAFFSKTTKLKFL